MASIPHSLPSGILTEFVSGNTEPLTITKFVNKSLKNKPTTPGVRAYLDAVADLKWMKSFDAMTNEDLLRLFCRVSLTTFVAGALLTKITNNKIFN